MESFWRFLDRLPESAAVLLLALALVLFFLQRGGYFLKKGVSGKAVDDLQRAIGEVEEMHREQAWREGLTRALQTIGEGVKEQAVTQRLHGDILRDIRETTSRIETARADERRR